VDINNIGGKYMDIQFTRICQFCGKNTYYTNESKLNRAIKRNSRCKSCSTRNANIKHRGNASPFFGKHHSEKTKKLLRDLRKDETYDEKFRTNEYREKQRQGSIGKNNPMHGKNLHDVWVEKYGKEIADQKQLELNKKRSIQMKGKGNNMYGKPSPNKAGKGISGRYKDFYFRSLRELYYIITYLEPNNLPIISAERKDLQIPYTNYDGAERTYRADFLVGNTLVEVKPKKLKDTPLIKLKEEAAKKFCEEHNMIYKIEYIEIVDYSKINDLYKNGLITIDDKKKKNFEKYIN
jgi:hypothetical protein